MFVDVQDLDLTLFNVVLEKSNMGIKNAEFDDDFESVAKKLV
jgi:hypothetical protein